VFPVAALEQHGRHAPLFTDSLLMGEIARRAEERLGSTALFAPLQWLGNSTITWISGNALGRSAALHRSAQRPPGELPGARIPAAPHPQWARRERRPGKQAVFEVRQRHRDRRDLLLLFATYWNLTDRAAQSHPDLQDGSLGHACEWETSMVLRLNPKLIKDHTNVPAQGRGNPFEPASRGWIMPDRSQPGHVRRSRHATAEKGEALFAAFTDGAEAMIRRMIAWDGRSWDG